MNTELFKQDLAEGYSSPCVEVTHVKSEGVLCGSFNGAQIPGYGEVDPWEED